MVRIPTHAPLTHPGEMLLHDFLKPYDMTTNELADWLGTSRASVDELVTGKRDVTPETASRLEDLFGLDAQVWLDLQQAWDLYHAMPSH